MKTFSPMFVSMGSVLDLSPNSDYLREIKHASNVAGALERDWRCVGQDLWNATTQYKVQVRSSDRKGTITRTRSGRKSAT